MAVEGAGPQGGAMTLGTLAAFVTLLAVAAGAFGAHALKDHLDPASLATFETAARYQLIHGLAAVFAADRAAREGGTAARNAALAFLVGTLFFGGSLYTLALGGPRILGAVAPLGGLGYMTGWAFLAASFARR
jgi:uncharacterized membrane protein YgdD (TMEM256/DUF423 family)